MQIPASLEKTTVSGRQRYQLLDLGRGLAIVAMAIFHIGWDAYYFGFSPVDVTSDPPWVAFQKSILSSFLLLVGASLVLAHGNGIRWRQFWRRWAIIVIASLLVTAGTYFMFPEYFVFFGVLHAIALFSLLALPLVRAPWPVVLIAGVLVILISFGWSDPIMERRELAWIGFWPVSPPTADVVPIFPWFGAVLVGMGAMRWLLGSPFAERFRSWQSPEPLVRGLAFIGRWSLPVYLLHQPVIIAIFYLLLMAKGVNPFA